MKVLVVTEPFTRDGMAFARGDVVRVPGLVELLTDGTHDQHFVVSDHDDPADAAAALPEALAAPKVAGAADPAPEPTA